MPKYLAYENGKDKNKAVIVTVVFIILVVCGFFIYQHFSSLEPKVEEETFQTCSLDYQETKKLLLEEEKEHEIFEIKDYLFYGEYLNLYHDEYSIFERDVLTGKTITLKNLCNQKEYVYMITGDVDGQIPLDSLEDGFYSIYVSYENKQRRAYSSSEIEDVFYTIRRTDESKKITLLACRTLLDSSVEQNLLDHHYLYLMVEKEEVPDDIYDVVIDPGYAYDMGDYVEKGGFINDLNESNETFKAALLIKEELEKYGLHVFLTRGSADELNITYGSDGRLHKAYESKAKYFIELKMNNATNKNQHGFMITYSSFATNKFAVSLKNHFINETELTPNLSSVNKIDGIKPSVKSNGYDGMMNIRESGGKALNAATYSEKAQLNHEFAYQNRYGLQAVSLSYLYLSNEFDANYWKENASLVAKATANALLDYFGMLKC